MESGIGEKTVKSLLEASPDQVKLWQVNVSQFISRLQAQYEFYSDVNSILIGFIRGLQLGFGLLTSPAGNELELSWIMDPAILTSSSQLAHKFDSGRDLWTNVLTDSQSDGLMLYILELAVEYVKITKVTREDPSFGLIDHILKSFYYKWSLDRMRKEENAVMKTSIFKDTSEGEAEDDFKRMFPDYEDVMSMPDPDNTTNEDANDEAHYRLMQLHLRHNSDVSTVGLPVAIEKGTNVMRSLARTFTPKLGEQHTVSNVLSSLVVSLSSSIDPPVKSNGVDFYHESCQEETTRVIELVNRIKTRIGDLLERWPEHSTLANIAVACEELLRLPVKTSVARFLQKVEQIFVFLHEWQSYASSEVTVSNLIDDTSALIVSWRKLELTTWSRLLEAEDLALDKELSRWWFYLYENVIDIPMRKEDKVDASDMVQTLSVFMSESPYGQFARRLDVLRTFASHAASLQGYDEYMADISNAVANVVAFFEQYLPQITEATIQCRKGLSKEMQDVILLASWKDTNMSALKESARRSHHKLYKVVRKYRAFINGKVTSIVDNPSKPNDTSAAVETYATSREVSLSLGKYSKLCKVLSSWETRPRRLKQVEGTISNVHSYIYSLSREELPSLEWVAVGAVEESQRLRKATPSVMTDESKKVVSSLRMEKSKALTTVFKQLKEAGLRYQVKSDVAARQALVSHILGSSKSLIGADRGEKYLFRILETLPRLRSAVGSSNVDVPVGDLQRGLAQAENLLAIIISQRNGLWEVFQSCGPLELIEKAAIQVSDLLDVDGSLEQTNLKEEYTKINYVIRWAPEVVNMALSVLRAGYSLSRAKEETKLSSCLTDFRDRMSDLEVRLNNYEPLYTYDLCTGEWTSLVEQVRNEINKFCASLKVFRADSPECELAATVALSWASGIHFSAESVFHSETSTVDDLDTALCDLCDSILVVVQNINQLSAEALSEEHDNWFSLSQSRILRYSKSLHTPAIMAKIASCLAMVGSIGSTGMSRQCIALVGLAVPFIREFVELHRVVRSVMIRNYSSVCKSSYLLISCLNGLATDGFCTPQEETTEKDTSAMLEGTGLGDGEAGQDNSNDIEDDEDLSENAQKDNPDQSKDEDREDQEDNAKEIEGDMAGELEDAPDQEEEDQKSDREEHEDELDDEVGEIDDLDPNQVDEKMWDQKGDDSRNEKESETVPEGNQDDMQANEEHDQQGEQDQNEGQQNEEGGSDEEEDDVGEQEDDVKQRDNDELEENVPEGDALELPEGMNLDDDDDEKEGKEDEDIPDMDEDMEDLEESNDVLETGDDERPNEEGNDNEEEKVENEEADAIDVDNDIGQVDEMKQEENGSVEQEEPEPTETVDQSESTDAKMDIETDGLHGPDSSNDDNANPDESTTSKQQSSSKGEGADMDQLEEQNNVDNSGGQSSLKPEEKKDAEEDISSADDKARQEANESIKKLGDAMKEFYSRRQEIKEASQKDEAAEEVANIRPDEFEHVEGENSSKDTQALGEANSEQTQAIDDKMAIDEDEEVPQEPQEHQVEENEIKEEEQEQEQEQDGAAGDVASRGISQIGQRASQDDKWLASEDKSMDVDIPDEQELQFYDELSGEVLAPSRSLEEARTLWRKYDVATQELALSLCEQLRLILEPTLATKLRGDFKTGKRLNMKRIIPYIASSFKKDKIWMRRTKPSKRQFQIMIAVDDSKSMKESQCVDLAFQTIALVSKSLTLLESGQLAITRFGETAQMLHGFQKPFSSQSGAEVLQWFGFDQQRTDVQRLLENSIKLFEIAKHDARQDLWQLEIIISDGVCEDHDRLRRLVRRAQEERIMMVFVVVDGINKSGSILEMNQVRYQADGAGNMTLKMDMYLDSFPFDYYVIVRDIRELPGVLASVLRQYFAEVVEH
jgi:midasin